MSTPHAALQMANNLEGGGRTPLLPPEELEQLGFKLVAYPLSLLGISMRAMQSALQLLKARVLDPAGPVNLLAQATVTAPMQPLCCWGMSKCCVCKGLQLLQACLACPQPTIL